MAAGVLGMAFIPYYNQLMEILSTNPDLRKSANGIFKQVAYGACGTTVGGVFGGPVGAMVGGLAALFIGYMLSDGYDSVIKVLMKMSDSEKETLVNRVQKLVGKMGIDALKEYMGIPTQRENLLRMIKDFARNQQGR